MNRLWWTQVKAVIRLELKKTFFAKRGLWIYAVAALPVLLFIAYAVATSNQQHRSARIARESQKQLSYQDLLAVKSGMTKDEVVAILGKPPLDFHWTERRPTGPGSFEEIPHERYQYSDGQNDLYVEFLGDKVTGATVQDAYNLGQDAIGFAGVFQFFFLRLAIFFGCLGVFMNLFRGEVLDRSLHFYFLSPIRREVLMAGKFLAGLLATCVIFGASLIFQILALVWQLSPQVRDHYLFASHGLEQAGVYLGVTVLACIGYGAFFLIAGMLFRNPLIPAAT